MSRTEINFNNTSELQEGIKNGTITSVEIVSHYLDKIQHLDPTLHAFTEVYAEEALNSAKAADALRSSGLLLSPLHGLPIAIKDLIDIEGRVTTSGSPLFVGVKKHSATIIELIRKAGLIVIGKTHTVQFAFGAWGNNEHMGTPRNPWGFKTHLTPGGSSSGSAVAVASGMVPLAIGTDTGGSIRVPASFCSITGMKTTVKRISTKGIAPLSESLDTVGFFAKDAAPLLDLFNILSITESTKDHELKFSRQGLSKLRMGRLQSDELTGVSPDIIQAYEKCIEKLIQHGVAIETIEMPFKFETVAKVSSVIMLSEAAAEYGELAKDANKPIDSTVRPRLIAGSQLTAPEYVNALRAQNAMKQEFTKATAGLDAILTPSSVCTPIPIENANHDRPPVRYTRLFNLMDMCAISIPIGFDKDDLPIGLQIGGFADHDEKILLIAQHIQSMTDFHKTYPNGMQFY